LIDIDCAVIGAGVVGLAIAHACAKSGRSTVLIEQHPNFGSETSSRNSSVIHSGIYYPPDSLKSHTCIKGRQLIYEFCTQYAVPYRQCGKLIVATHANEESRLEQLFNNALQVGLTDLQPLDKSQAQQREPELSVTAALWVPSTGIVDSHAFMTALLGDFEQHTGIYAPRTQVSQIRQIKQGFEIHLTNETTPLLTRHVINSAGLHATQLASRIEGLDATHIPQMHLAKGHYFDYNGKSPFKHLIYPVPVDGGLGVHVTLDLAGRMKFGPDVEWVKEIHYETSAERATSFYPSIRRYWPTLPDNSLQPAYTGMRPKLSGPGEAVADFYIQDANTHQVPGLICLYGIESPGLTASLALAEEVVSLLDRS
jgi:L-2-hydroxyglutarate oxidase LhgO